MLDDRDVYPDKGAYLNLGNGFASSPIDIGDVALSRAVAFQQAPISHRVTVNTTRDLDGDGLADLIVDQRDAAPGDAQSFTVLFNTGASWQGALRGAQQLTGPVVGGPRELMFDDPQEDAQGTWYTQGVWLDADADGVDEYVDPYADVAWGLAPADAPRGALTSITNRWGGQVTIDYRPATDEAVVTGETGSGGPLWVVESITREATSAAPAATTTYRYEDPVINLDTYGERAFRGYRRVSVAGPLGATTQSEFAYEGPGARWELGERAEHGDALCPPRDGAIYRGRRCNKGADSCRRRWVQVLG